jgi:hypothetical protein
LGKKSIVTNTFNTRYNNTFAFVDLEVFMYRRLLAEWWQELLVTFNCTYVFINIIFIWYYTCQLLNFNFLRICYLALHYDVTMHVDDETRDISEVQKLKGRNIFSKMWETLSFCFRRFVIPTL